MDRFRLPGLRASTILGVTALTLLIAGLASAVVRTPAGAPSVAPSPAPSPTSSPTPSIPQPSPTPALSSVSGDTEQGRSREPNPDPVTAAGEGRSVKGCDGLHGTENATCRLRRNLQRHSNEGLRNALEHVGAGTSSHGEHGAPPPWPSAAGNGS